MTWKSVLYSLCLCVAITIACAMPAAAFADGKEGPGLKVGKKAPTFKLNDQHGKPLASAKLLGEEKVALVFYRSADW